MRYPVCSPVQRLWLAVAVLASTLHPAATRGQAAPDKERVFQSLDEVVVTGTRIRRAAEDFPNPVISISAESIERSGRTNVAELLSKSPALIGSPVGAETAGSRSAYGEAGLNILNLRNLGADRTLVLVDGRRHVSSRIGSAAVDIDSIPTDLIEAVDVLTGGASAIYGADGVSGVVNFRLKRNFEGASFRGQIGTSGYGDGTNTFAAMTLGHNFRDDRANVAIAFEYNMDSRVYDQRRPHLRDPRAGNLYRNQQDIPDDPNIPDNVPYHDVRYADSSRNGAIDTDFDEIPDFQGTGSVYDRGQVLRGSGGYTVGGSSTSVSGYQGDLFPALRRSLVNALGHFDLNDHVSLYAEAKYADVRARTLAQPSYDVYQFVARDNPFMPQAIRDAIVPGAAAEYFGDPAMPDGVLVTRDDFDLGINDETDHRRTFRVVVGTNGQITDHLRYDLSYVYGSTDIRYDLANDRVTTRWLAAIDAVTDPLTGKPVCRAVLDGTTDPDLAGCIPYNIFGDGVRDPAAAAFVNTTTTNRAKLTQSVISGSVSGDFGTILALPGGPIEYALGFEYRRESSDSRPDPRVEQGLTWNSPLTAAAGSFNVKEAFAETNLTLFKNRPGVHLWSIGGAVRFSDYSSLGHTTSWKLDTLYSPVKSFSIRGTLSQAVRAPNIGELYKPQSSSYEFITDPCDINELNNGSATREANCASILRAIGIDPTTFEPSTSTISSIAVQGIDSGNAGLSVETARTWTAGIVWQPEFLKSFSLTADWYSIRIKDAINTAEVDDIAKLCVDQPTTDNAFCPNLSRDPRTGFINGFRVEPQNVADFRTEGLDVTARYTLPTAAAGSFSFSLTAGHVNRLDFIATPGAEVRSDLDQEFEPRNSAVFDINWERNAFSIRYGLNWFSRTKRYTDAELRGDPDIAARRYLYAKRSWEQDINANWDVNEHLAVWVGVNNLFDEKPEFGYRSYPVSALGRFFYAGAKARF
ncbi:MAG: TonB-dependent receptor [Steroidobacteraceae bacterium]